MKSHYNRKIFSWILILGGLGWIFHLLKNHSTDPQLFLPTSWGWFVSATLFTTSSIALNGVIFYLFLQPDGKKLYSLRHALKSYYFAQLLRYLPGRFWGIVYQINASQGYIPAHRLTRANLDFMIFSLIASGFVSILIIANQYSWPPHYRIGILVIGIVLIGGALLGGINRILSTCKRLFRIRNHRFYTFFNMLAEEKISPPQLLKAGFLFLLSWALYLCGWALLENVYPQFSEADFIALCAFYSLASIMGVLSAITPAGMGVREAIFLLLALNSQPPEVVAFFALFGRLWLIIIDLALLLIPVVILVFERFSANDETSNS